MENEINELPKIIIIGGGFGGIQFSKKLKNQDVEVLMLDKHNYHTFQPLLYQVATGGLEPDSIAFPLRKVFKGQSNFTFRVADAKQIVPAENKVITDIGEFEYDALVIATGADTNFFGNKDLSDRAFPMKSTVEALQLRHRLLHNFEDALTAKSAAELQSLMTIVIVGGGPTGVELSGAIADMRKYQLPKDYPELDFGKMKIY